MSVGQVYRASDPLVVQQIWAAIQYVRQQKQMANVDRITRYMEREHGILILEAERQLELAVAEELVDEYTHAGMKGIKRSSTEQLGFKIPDTPDNWDRGTHDWYCFECHKNGSVVCCTECHRVYHPGCIHDEFDEVTFVCIICQQQEAARKKPRIKRKELNRLLYFAVLRLKEKTKELHKMGMRNEPKQFGRFMYQYMDLNTMESKAVNKKYKYIEQFKADAQTLYHNVFICYGENGGMAQLARIMIVDCQYDLDEIGLCKDCYYYSNDKPQDWFSLVCDPPHELVFAKQKGFCYWPAKVIQIIPTGYDVRFFGGWHQRAVIPKSSIKPIEVKEKMLNVKKTAAYNKSMEELRLHQKYLSQHKPGDNDDRDDDEDEWMDTSATTAVSSPRPAAKRPRKSSNATATSSTSSPFAEQTRVTSITESPKDMKKAKVVLETFDETISSSLEKSAMTPEDINMVTSSEDNVVSPRIISTKDTATQTSKKNTAAKNKSSQTEQSGETTPTTTATKSAVSDGGTKDTSEQETDVAAITERVRKELQKEFEEDKQQAVCRAVSSLEKEVERARKSTEEKIRLEVMEEMKKLQQKHNTEISATKKKQWCYNCEEEAMYHCCWNTSYCSIKCQQENWHKEHKRMCRRKR